MPATTAVSAVPSGPGVEASIGPVPGFYLSQAARNQAGGAAIMELGALFDPDRWLGVPGLIVGARIFGNHDDTPGEPMLGYRRELGEGLSMLAVGFGSSKRATSRLATYHGARYGAELAFDAKLLERKSTVAIHAQAAANATRIVASGNYCVDSDGAAKDCDEKNPSINQMINGRLSGLYPAGTLTLAADLFRSPSGAFHGARLAAMFTFGEMPLVSNGVQQGAATYFSGGFTLAIGLGASMRPAAEPD